ncbi:MAG: 2'-deoxycytidine 5'-triphosphate deaminase [Candidatus Woesearchaeota archaeon]
MSLDKRIGFCLADRQIREKIEHGKIIVPTFDASRIQPSSFEPTVGEEVFILDTETKGIFRPNLNETIYRTLLQLPGRQRQKIDLTGGFELKKGFTYLIPLEERLVLQEKEFIKSSPKSSFGRIFLNTRLLTDYNPCFDEINAQYKTETELQQWLLVQPLAFNAIVYPGISLNQLRFFSGFNAKLNSAELSEEFNKNPLLYTKDEENKLIPAEPIITEDLQIHLDVSGQYTEGIVGLRARHNPAPIDLKDKSKYEAEYFFEPMVKGVPLIKGEHYLFASHEVLKIPPHLNVELKSHSHVGITGPLHFAGFIDNGFEGDLVFEIRSDELSNMSLEDKMPISKLDVFRTCLPEKIYGKEIGSNYQKQIGPRPAKFFKPFDFVFAARNYQKLNRCVLVLDAKVLNRHRSVKEGLELISENPDGLLQDIQDPDKRFFQSRYDCEFDELILQPIPYVLMFGPDQTVFTYIRAKNIKDYGDKRLFGKHSIGVGGHINESDSSNCIEECIRRELEEEITIEGNPTDPKLVGTLMAYNTPVNRVHFGLIFSIHTKGKIRPKEAALVSGRMIPIGQLVGDPEYENKYETWSKIIIPYLEPIYSL